MLPSVQLLEACFLDTENSCWYKLMSWAYNLIQLASRGYKCQDATQSDELNKHI